MKKIIAMIAIFGAMLLGAIDLQTASKSELMGIKGIGDKKADAIIEYRKTNTIKSADDLKNIKGFGDSIVNNIKSDNLDKKPSETKKVKEKIDKNL